MGEPQWCAMAATVVWAGSADRRSLVGAAEPTCTSAIGDMPSDVLLCIVVFIDDKSDSIATRGLWAIARKVVLLCSAAIVDITIGSSGDTACMQGSA